MLLEDEIDQTHCVDYFKKETHSVLLPILSES